MILVDTAGRLQNKFNLMEELSKIKTVIDKKAKEWKGTDMEKYLCPDTLFGSKFEKYLNQTINTPSQTNPRNPSGGFNDFKQRDYDYDELEKKLLGQKQTSKMVGLVNFQENN